jgi:hypothetical protein
MSTLPTGLPGCGQAATIRFEIYSRTPTGGTYGSLDGSLYVCAEHADEALSAIEAAGLTPYTVNGPGKRCGDGYDFTGDQPGALHAPEPATTVVTPVGEPAGEPCPPWCNGVDHGHDYAQNIHYAEIGEVLAGPFLVFVALMQNPGQPGQVTVMNDRDSVWIDMTTEKAIILRDLLTEALGRLGGQA